MKRVFAYQLYALLRVLGDLISSQDDVVLCGILLTIALLVARYSSPDVHVILPIADGWRTGCHIFISTHLASSTDS